MDEMCEGTRVTTDGRELFTCRDSPDRWRLMAKEMLVLGRMLRTEPARSFIGPERPTGEPVQPRKWAHDLDGTMPDPAGRGTAHLCGCDRCQHSPAANS